MMDLQQDEPMKEWLDWLEQQAYDDSDPEPQPEVLKEAEQRAMKRWFWNKKGQDACEE